MSADEMYPSFNPGPTKPDGSMNFECHCVGHLVASPCGYEFRNVINKAMTSLVGYARRCASQFASVSEKAKYVPRRSLLYVPASSEKMLNKVPLMKSDCVVLELEDGVALTSKAVARSNAVKTLNQLQACYRALSSELSKAEVLPAAFMIPKVDTPEDVATIYDLFRTTFGANRITDSPTRLVIWIESARALLDMPRIVSSVINLHRNSGFFKLDAVVFGSDDFCADIGAIRTAEGLENIYARQRFVTVCKAFQLQAIDSVYIDLKDEEGLRESCLQGHSWGFTGKQAIHPSQVPIIQDSYKPSAERVEWAKSLADAFSMHQQGGTGAFSFRGQMIDRPLLLQAMNVLQMQERIMGGGL
ncbi:unnamed protein product, partial [Mesorhabditis belari]|uniref:HpcH/HpaI aldolase/citrate lyase domain-containing protein n=1 Tax=Mesorhabditis belari TaxID=2138241 RepID=A0AAF3F9I8_9BILA